MSPPAACGAPLRLELSSLGGAGDECPTGFFWTGDKCAADAKTPHQCRTGDLSDCTAQCDQHAHLGSCFELASMLTSGKGVAPDLPRAAAIFKKGCDGGHARSCNGLGNAYIDGTGIAKDQLEASRLYHTACEAGAAAGCANLGNMHFEGTGVPVNATLGVRLFLRACNAGLPGGCHNVALAYAAGKGVPQDDVQATSYARRGCDGGERRSCAVLGIIMKRTDPAGAVRFLDDQCNRKIGDACQSLFYVYFHGDGAPKDPIRALQYAQRACDLEVKAGCDMGKLSAIGDSGEAFVGHVQGFFQKRCERGDPMSCAMHGNTLMESTDAAERERGLSMLREGCKKKVDWACDRLRVLKLSP